MKKEKQLFKGLSISFSTEDIAIGILYSGHSGHRAVCISLLCIHIVFEKY